MSKFAARVQDKRKARARRADLAHKQLMAIYERATQGGSDAYLTTNQASDPERIVKLKQQAQERRDNRNAKRIRQTTNEAVPSLRQSNGQPNRRNVRAQRIGKIRGLARRFLRKAA